MIYSIAFEKNPSELRTIITCTLLVQRILFLNIIYNLLNVQKYMNYYFWHSKEICPNIKIKHFMNFWNSVFGMASSVLVPTVPLSSNRCPLGKSEKSQEDMSGLYGGQRNCTTSSSCFVKRCYTRLDDALLIVVKNLVIA